MTEQQSHNSPTKEPAAENPPEKSPPKTPQKLLQIIGSTLAAAMGVQSNRNRERDFSQGSVKTYVISGVIFTAVFVTSLVLLVKYLLAQA